MKILARILNLQLLHDCNQMPGEDTNFLEWHCHRQRERRSRGYIFGRLRFFWISSFEGSKLVYWLDVHGNVGKGEKLVYIFLWGGCLCCLLSNYWCKATSRNVKIWKIGIGNRASSVSPRKRFKIWEKKRYLNNQSVQFTGEKEGKVEIVYEILFCDVTY